MTHPIGIFDSGVGGLTVLKALRQVLPYENIIYVGDTARVPYGEKSPEMLLSFGRQIIDFLLQKNAKAIILACGTTSSTIYDTLKIEYPHIPLIDVIRPAIEKCTAPHIKNLGLIATPATIKSGLFTKLILEKNPNIQIHSRPCPLFAPMIEAGFAETTLTASAHPILHFTAETYLSDLHNQLDTLILGCTHYPLIQSTLTKILGGKTPFINLSTTTANAAKSSLQNAHCLSELKITPNVEFYVSGNLIQFNIMAESILKGSNSYQPAKPFVV